MLAGPCVYVCVVCSAGDPLPVFGGFFLRLTPLGKMHRSLVHFHSHQLIQHSSGCKPNSNLCVDMDQI